MDRVDAPATEQARLKRIEAEYKMTMRVIAVVTERLLALTKAERVEISDMALIDSPDLIAMRDDARKLVMIRVGRYYLAA